jgi:hypothetical protein
MDEDQPINRRSLTEILAILTILAKQAEASNDDENPLSNQAEASGESFRYQSMNTDQPTGNNTEEPDIH